MLSRLLTKFYRLDFDYRPLIQPTRYAGEVSIFNPNRTASITGAFLEGAPSCDREGFLSEVRQWFLDTNGSLAEFSIFNRAPIETDRYKITARIADLTGNIELQTWKKVGLIWTKQPYVFNQAYPTFVSGSGLSLSSNNTILGGTIGQEVNVRFGFIVAPEAPSFSYNRYQVNELPFKVLPRGARGYLNV